MKSTKLISRIILGIIFTFSGFVKAVDPLGSAYKFSDYFTDAFGVPELSSISLTLAIILSAFEFLVGICLLLNIKPRLASLGALIFMAIFTPLTLYIAIASPVEDCGCFGDAVKLSNWETFLKNIILLPLSVFLFNQSKSQYSTFKGKTDWILTTAFFALVLYFQYYNLRHLPVIDFMPYKVGTYIPDKMKMPAGEKQDSFAVFYTMKHLETGKIMEVNDGEYLQKEIWKDTLWQITETSEPKLIKKGYKPPIYNFKAYPVDLTLSNQQSTDDKIPTLLADEKFSFFIISYDFAKSSRKAFDNMADLINYAYTKNIEAHLLTANQSDLNKYAMRLSFPAKFYNSDPITLKTIIRSNPGLLLLKNGTIIAKWHYNDIPSIKKFDKIISK